MFILMVVIFVLGYIAIALEHPLNVNKAASALIIGTLTWVAYMIGVQDILHLGFSRSWQEFVTLNPDAVNAHKEMVHFVGTHEVLHHLGETSKILFFLLMIFLQQFMKYP